MNVHRIAPVGIALALAGVATAVSATTVVLYPKGYTVHSPEDLQVERLTLPEVTYTGTSDFQKIIDTYLADPNHLGR